MNQQHRVDKEQKEEINVSFDIVWPLCTQLDDASFRGSDVLYGIAGRMQPDRFGQPRDTKRKKRDNGCRREKGRYNELSGTRQSASKSAAALCSPPGGISGPLLTP